MPKYQETIEAMNPFDDAWETIDVEYETALNWGDKEIFDITDMVLTSKTGVILDKATVSSEWLEEVEERLLKHAIEAHGDEE